MLLFRINKNKAYCLYVWFGYWHYWKVLFLRFDLDTIPMKGVKLFFENLNNEWNRKYRI